MYKLFVFLFSIFIVTTSFAWPDINTTGTLNTLIIFARCNDHPSFDTAMKSNLLSDIASYYSTMSGGQLSITGSTISINLPNNISYYSTISDANAAVLNAADPSVDFREYDNNSDGTADLIIICYPYVTSLWGNSYSGYSRLELSSTLTLDGIYLNNDIGCGITMKQYPNPASARIATKFVACHEIAHKLIGGYHISAPYLTCLAQQGSY